MCPTCRDEMYVRPKLELCPTGTCRSCLDRQDRRARLTDEELHVLDLDGDDQQWEICEGPSCCWGRGMGKPAAVAA